VIEFLFNKIVDSKKKKKGKSWESCPYSNFLANLFLIKKRLRSLEVDSIGLELPGQIFRGFEQPYANLS